MLEFLNDYGVLCHERVWEALCRHRAEVNRPYGADLHSARAKELLLAACASTAKEHRVFFFHGGTQVNACIIDALLEAHESVLAADSGHITNHEAGAIEAKGHRVDVLPAEDGKVTAKALAHFMKAYEQSEFRSRMPAPALLYLSQSTELGTVYSEEELRRLRRVCDRFSLNIYIDGARMASGSTAEGAAPIDVVTEIADAFTLGGTKNGLIAGEALLVRRSVLPKNFVFLKTQIGAVIAKSCALGIQFATLFEDGLYWEIGREENRLAGILRAGFERLGFRLYSDSRSNQLFVCMKEEEVEALREAVSFELFCTTPEGEKVLRFCTSFATREADCHALIALCEKLRG